MATSSPAWATSATACLARTTEIGPAGTRDQYRPASLGAASIGRPCRTASSTGGPPGGLRWGAWVCMTSTGYPQICPDRQNRARISQGERTMATARPRTSTPTDPCRPADDTAVTPRPAQRGLITWPHTDDPGRRVHLPHRGPSGGGDRPGGVAGPADGTAGPPAHRHQGCRRSGGGDRRDEPARVAAASRAAARMRRPATCWPRRMCWCTCRPRSPVCVTGGCPGPRPSRSPRPPARSPYGSGRSWTPWWPMR
jgi:hypothetical protein